jgi:hypothetical protein
MNNFISFKNPGGRKLFLTGFIILLIVMILQN